MSTPMDHIAYLSQEIGPRPAGTEEEQQAALYITERLQKDAHLSAQIEDFTCNSNALMTPIICYGVAIVAVLLGVILPVIAIPAGVLALAAAAVAISEALDHPLLSQVFTKGVSQNIVAKYEPTQSSDAAGSRRRKVIVVANYDSGKGAPRNCRRFRSCTTRPCVMVRLAEWLLRQCSCFCAWRCFPNAPLLWCSPCSRGMPCSERCSACVRSA